MNPYRIRPARRSIVPSGGWANITPAHLGRLLGLVFIVLPVAAFPVALGIEMTLLAAKGVAAILATIWHAVSDSVTGS